MIRHASLKREYRINEDEELYRLDLVLAKEQVYLYFKQGTTNAQLVEGLRGLAEKIEALDG